ncbi:hypothetical protein ACTOB_004077 [Actinoplanes oblitus]|uniref:Uncharacterized protein n=1 Tax=Actinoplanes oblitus TaxID=3040509 RepID=A0ABY8WR95_9ACTN|nr:hypothetical protein [Actinoplanes oblitus]WIN00376.1 hypothetical protein ACTOB_004077 [Actinoplanes oblitus]
MRRIAITAVTSAALLTGAGSGWEPAPTPPFRQEAGVNCDFPLSAEPVVDEVVTRVLQRYPDGSIRRDAYRGDLVVRVTNTETGAAYDADVSGSAVVDHGADGSQTWYVAGPVLLRVREGQGNIPRGLWIVDGVYRLRISPTGYRTLTMVTGTLDNVCDHL